MNQSFITKDTDGVATAYQPVQRTLIITMGSLATTMAEHLPPAFNDLAALAGVVAVIDAANAGADLSTEVRDRLAGISRAGARESLAASGYVMDRMKDLALHIVVDVADQESAETAGDMADLVAGIAQEGWGLDTRTILIALANDWAESAARVGLRTLAETAPESLVALLPLNRVNELGLEMDSREDYLSAAAAIIEVLVATPLRDAPQWAESVPGPSLAAPTLTTTGLASWTWEPEPVRDALALAWKAQVIAYWLAEAEPEQAQLATQQAANWFSAQSLLPQALVPMLESSVSPYAVPGWHMPYPWRAAEAISHLRELSDALIAGRGGAVELVVEDWNEWLAGQEQSLHAELATCLDQEPVAGFDLVLRFLKELILATDDAACTVEARRDELEEQATDLTARLELVLGEVETIFQQWPADNPIAWATMLLRPWRWPGFILDYWSLGNLAREAEQLLAQQIETEREQVLVAAAETLYRRFAVAVRAEVDHLEEVVDMLQSGRALVASKHAPDAEAFVTRALAQDNTEQAAANAATEVGGLGQLARQLDEQLLDRLAELGRQRYQYLIGTPAVEMLPKLYQDEGAFAEWWVDLQLKATPLWLFDDACQPENSRLMEQVRTTICATGADRLRALLSLPDTPDWHWLPMHDRRRIIVMRWRAGVALP